MKRVITHEMIKQAVGVAEEAFWASIAKQFPEAKRGNLDITVSVPTTMQNEYAVKEWVITNIGAIAE